MLNPPPQPEPIQQAHSAGVLQSQFPAAAQAQYCCLQTLPLWSRTRIYPNSLEKNFSPYSCRQTHCSLLRKTVAIACWVLCALHTVSQVVSLTTLFGRYSVHLHFIDDHTGPERLGHLPRVTQPGDDRAGISSQLMPNSCSWSCTVIHMTDDKKFGVIWGRLQFSKLLSIAWTCCWKETKSDS